MELKMDTNIDLLLKYFSTEDLEEIILNSLNHFENFKFKQNEQSNVYPVTIHHYNQS